MYKDKKISCSCFKVEEMIDWLIDLNGMSTYIALFYAYRFGNRVHCMLIFNFLCSSFISGVYFIYTALSNTNNFQRDLFGSWMGA